MKVDTDVVRNEIIACLGNYSLPADSQCVGRFTGKYERLWLHEYKGYKFIIGDPLDGFYDFHSSLDDFLNKEGFAEGDLFKILEIIEFDSDITVQGPDSWEIDWGNVTEDFKANFMKLSIIGDVYAYGKHNTNHGHNLLTILDEIAGKIHEGSIGKNDTFKSIWDSYNYKI